MGSSGYSFWMFDFCLDRTNLYLVDHFLKGTIK
jgi:hypothetical protein